MPSWAASKRDLALGSSTSSAPYADHRVSALPTISQSGVRRRECPGAGLTARQSLRCSSPRACSAIGLASSQVFPGDRPAPGVAMPPRTGAADQHRKFHAGTPAFHAHANAAAHGSAALSRHGRLSQRVKAMSHHPHNRMTQCRAERLHGPLSALRRWWRERRTAAALHGLDDAGLKDLGIDRCQNPSTARRHSSAYGRL